MGPHTASQWIRSNMLDEDFEPEYSEELGRLLTKPEVKFRKSRKLLEEDLPGWMTEYTKKKPIELRSTRSSMNSDHPRPWRTSSCGGKSPRSPRKPKKKRSFRKSHRGSSSHNYSTIDSGFNEDYKSRRARYINASTCTSEMSSSISSSDNEAENESRLLEEVARSPAQRSFKVSFHTYPRVSPSRKLDNINIVFCDSKPQVSPEIVDQILDSPYFGGELCSETEDGCVQSQESSPSPSPTTKFFDSNKPTELERVIQKSRRESGRSLVQEIIEELNHAVDSEDLYSEAEESSVEQGTVQKSRRESGRSLAWEIIDDLDRSIDSTMPVSGDSYASHVSFVKSMISALESSVSYEQGCDFDDTESFDSDLVHSTSISVDSGSSRSSTPCLDDEYYTEEEKELEEEEDVYWIPCKLPVCLRRTSSLLSMPWSSASSTLRRRPNASPNLSPIQSIEDHFGLMEYQERLQKHAQQLRKDSGCFSDKTTTPTSPAVAAEDDGRESLASIPSPPVSSLSFWEPSPAPSPTLSEKRESVCSAKTRMSPRRCIFKSVVL